MLLPAAVAAVAVAAVAAAVVAPGGAAAWGHVGHSIVAAIAVKRLSAPALGVLDVFLGGEHTLPEIAPWPDTYAHTPQGLWSLPLHFANIPVGATTFVPSRDCAAAPWCVTAAIANYSATVAKQAAAGGVPCRYSFSKAPCALEFLTHFVGDVHQPLHVSFACDQGGNFVPATFFGMPTELHAVWDEYIINRWNANYPSAAKELEAMITPQLVAKYTASLNPVDWAKESVGYDLSNVYVFEKGQNDTHCCGIPTKDGSLKSKAELPSRDNPVAIGQWYYDTNLPLVKQRLIAGGIRLGALLEQVLAPSGGR